MAMDGKETDKETNLVTDGEKNLLWTIKKATHFRINHVAIIIY